MAELKERPEPAKIEVTVPGQNGPETRDGADLDDVLRGIIFDLRRQNRWASTNETAKHLGLPQSTLALFLDETRPGGRIALLSRICAALKLSPTELFARHERYRDKAQFADDFVYDRFRAVVGRGEAARLLRILEVATEARILDEVLTVAERLIPARKRRPTRQGSDTKG